MLFHCTSAVFSVLADCQSFDRYRAWICNFVVALAIYDMVDCKEECIESMVTLCRYLFIYSLVC